MYMYMYIYIYIIWFWILGMSSMLISDTWLGLLFNLAGSHGELRENKRGTELAESLGLYTCPHRGVACLKIKLCGFICPCFHFCLYRRPIGLILFMHKNIDLTNRFPKYGPLGHDNWRFMDKLHFYNFYSFYISTFSDRSPP